MRHHILCLILLVWSIAPGGAEEDAIGTNLRVSLEAEVLDELLQAERWAVIDAQDFGEKAHAKERRRQDAIQLHQRAALEYQQFGQSFPDSLLWSFAMYCEAWHLRKARRSETARSRLEELIEIDDRAPEVPEAKLLLGRIQQEVGDLDAALATYRALQEDHPTSSAATPARIWSDDLIIFRGREREDDADTVARARLGVLRALTEDIDRRSSNRAILVDGLKRLSGLLGRQADVDGLVTMAASLSEAFNTSDRGIRDLINRNFGTAMRLCLNNGLDDRYNQIAQLRWTDGHQRLMGASRAKLDWIKHASNHTDSVAESRGTSPAELSSMLETMTEEILERLQNAARERIGSNRGREIADLVVRVLMDREDYPGALAFYREIIDRGLNADEVRRFFALALKSGQDPTIAMSDLIVDIEGDDARLRLRLDIFTQLAGAKRPDSPAYATQAIAILDGLADSDPERATDYLRRKAQLQMSPLGAYEEAIVTWKLVNTPPSSDVQIAKCHEALDQWREAFQTWSNIHAMNTDSETGANALVTMGRMAHRQLDNRALAIQLLMQVCDDYPNYRRAYSAAHTYLQNELDRTYTGGGGQRR